MMTIYKDYLCTFFKFQPTCVYHTVCLIDSIVSFLINSNNLCPLSRVFSPFDFDLTTDMLNLYLSSIYPSLLHSSLVPLLSFFFWVNEVIFSVFYFLYWILSFLFLLLLLVVALQLTICTFNLSKSI